MEYLRYIPAIITQFLTRPFKYKLEIFRLQKRAPALLDNLIQAFVMAPFFVLLEALQVVFGYEPYPGFHSIVQAKVEANIEEWQESRNDAFQPHRGSARGREEIFNNVEDVN
ncbi:putative endoplasmic reticulum membrane protein [Trifolium pratense]|uniref:Putative endoplasmic reticulum membrane protein n=1 Tax=Trifolium pratense TaxID=57577 RepID=A0A2K3M5Y9_TRIPR|nr:putative endoplasmic reticulum membrane protein [Trifolium pratense]